MAKCQWLRTISSLGFEGFFSKHDFANKKINKIVLCPDLAHVYVLCKLKGVLDYSLESALHKLCKFPLIKM